MYRVTGYFRERKVVRYFTDVYDAIDFKDIVDAKTGKTLFGTKHGMKAHEGPFDKNKHNLQNGRGRSALTFVLFPIVSKSKVLLFQKEKKCHESRSQGSD